MKSLKNHFPFRASFIALVLTVTAVHHAFSQCTPTPLIYNVSGGGSICAGGAGVTVTLDNSRNLVNYQLKIDGVNSGSPLAGSTGSALNWTNQTTAGVYTVVATNGAGCTATMNGSATVTVSTPAQFNVGGGGGYCGGTGLTVSLSGSATGVNYQLFTNGNPSTTIAGTGGVLNWTNRTTLGTYTIYATIASNGCGAYMTGNATIYDGLPALYTVSGGGTICSGATGLTVTLNNSSSGVNYQLKIGGTNSGSAVAGTGAALNWTNLTTAGVYTVEATHATAGCTRTMSASATITVNPAPASFNMGGGGSFCTGSTAPSVTLSGSTTGVNYQLKLSGSNSGSPVSGTGSGLTWTNPTAGSYTVVATVTATSCTATMSGTSTVTENPLPTLFNVGGGGPYCTGGATVTLDGSSSGVNYQLKLNGANSGSVVSGTGSALSWSSQTSAGTYTVVATNATTGCTRAMTGSVDVSVSSLPSLFTVSGGGTMCAGTSGLTIALSGSTSGVSYQLKVGGSNTGSPLSGTGSPLNFTNQTTAGSYTVVATAAGPGCVRTMTGSASITVNPAPTLYNVGGGGTACAGATGPTVSLSLSQVGVNYQLKVGSTNVGAPKAGNGTTALNWTNNTTTGTYTIVGTVTATSCSATMNGSVNVTINPLPVLYTLTAPNGPNYCAADPAGTLLVLTGSETGVNYQLKRGATNVGSTMAGTGNTLSWTNNTASGNYTVAATVAATSCLLTMTGTITVAANAMPTLYNASIAAPTTVCPGTPKTVNLSGSQTGVNYQLKVNGTDTGTPIAGTGSAIAFTNQTAPGTYTVYATNTTTGCARLMSLSPTITHNPLPTLYTLTGGGVTCSGGSSMSFSLSGSQTGATYQLKRDGANQGSSLNGTNAVLNWTNQTLQGTYTVLVTITATGCNQVMTGSPAITYLTQPVITGPTSIGTVNENLTSTSVAGSTYAWKRNGTAIGGSTSTLQITQGGTYDVTVSINGCNQTSAPFVVYDKATKYYNGIISSVRWRTDKAFIAPGSDLTGMFVYRYDNKYQLTEAQFANYTANAFTWGGNQFKVTNQTYDPNGNIESLKRYDGSGALQHDFDHKYNEQGTSVQQNNRLTSIPGYSSYLYTEIGQMTDDNKTGSSNDQFVEYDVTGKVTRVYSDAAKQQLKVVYTYDDAGFRLAKSNMVSGRTTWYIRDTSGNIVSVYETDHSSLATNQTEVPIYGSGKLGVYYPDPVQPASVAYEITDHLGNVRAIVKDRTTNYVATMEDNNEEDLSNPRVEEMQYFERLFETGVTDANMNHTAPLPTVATPNKAAYLFWNDNAGTQATDKAIGPSITLRVDVGDTLLLEAFARYEHQGAFNRNVDLMLLSSLLGGTFGGLNGLDANATSTLFQNSLGAAGFFGDTEPDRPFAYLNYMIFDESFAFVDGGAWRVDADGEFYPGNELPQEFDHVMFPDPIVTTTKGYVYVWVSNESKTAKVWFDDIKVTHTQGVVVQATDYGAWGDVVRESKTPAELIYRFGYQGQFAEKDEETGWGHFELREYDALIGRWTMVDPFRQCWSAYAGMGNNPINNIDPDGGFKSWAMAALYALFNGGGDIEQSIGGPRDGEWYVGNHIPYEFGPAYQRVFDLKSPIKLGVDLDFRFSLGLQGGEHVYGIEGFEGNILSKDIFDFKLSFDFTSSGGFSRPYNADANWYVSPNGLIGPMRSSISYDVPGGGLGYEREYFPKDSKNNLKDTRNVHFGFGVNVQSEKDLGTGQKTPSIGGSAGYSFLFGGELNYKFRRID